MKIVNNDTVNIYEIVNIDTVTAVLYKYCKYDFNKMIITGCQL